MTGHNSNHADVFDHKTRRPYRLAFSYKSLTNDSKSNVKRLTDYKLAGNEIFLRRESREDWAYSKHSEHDESYSRQVCRVENTSLG